MIRIPAVGFFAVFGVGVAQAHAGTIGFAGSVVEMTCVLTPDGQQADTSTVDVAVGSAQHPCRQARVQGRLASTGSGGSIAVPGPDRTQIADVDDDGLARLRWQAVDHRGHGVGVDADAAPLLVVIEYL